MTSCTISSTISMALRHARRITIAWACLFQFKYDYFIMLSMRLSSCQGCTCVIGSLTCMLRHSASCFIAASPCQWSYTPQPHQSSFPGF